MFAYNCSQFYASVGNRAKESLVVDFINETDLDTLQDKANVIIITIQKGVYKLLYLLFNIVNKMGKFAWADQLRRNTRRHPSALGDNTAAHCVAK